MARTALGAMGAASTTSRGPTANARRYVGSASVTAKRWARRPSPRSAADTSAVLVMARSSRDVTTVMSKGVLKRGSSKQGNARRADSASNCVNA